MKVIFDFLFFADILHELNLGISLILIFGKYSLSKVVDTGKKILGKFSNSKYEQKKNIQFFSISIPLIKK